MKFYHITFKNQDHYLNDDGCLIPRIPSSAADDEDKVTPRICLSDSIKGCIQAIGPCDRDLHTGAIFTVFEADMRNMSPKKLICPYELAHTKKVPDAMENMEYWYTSVLPVKEYQVKVLDFAASFEIAWSCVTIPQIQNICKKLKIDMPDVKTPMLAFEILSQKLNLKKKYKTIDRLYDEISELPWAQCLKVQNLKLEKM